MTQNHMEVFDPSDTFRDLGDQAGRNQDKPMTQTLLMRTYKITGVMFIPTEQMKRVSAYSKERSCWRHPPVFMISMTAVQLGVFFYYLLYHKEEGKTIGIVGSVPQDSHLIFDPWRREELWRFFSYMLVHGGYAHLFNNVLLQIFLGLPLEIVHSWWRILIIYCTGVVSGSLLTSVVNTDVVLAGASGGVYALLTAHVSNLILNWGSMGRPWIRVVGILTTATPDIALAIYERSKGLKSDVSAICHVGGALAGFLVGIAVLKNVEVKNWESLMVKPCLLLFASFIIFCCSWNISLYVLQDCVYGNHNISTTVASIPGMADIDLLNSTQHTNVETV